MDKGNKTLQLRISVLFRQNVGQKSVLTLPDLSDDFEQFRVWARNIGVFATDNSSLDYRLREAADARDGVVSLLETLNNDLIECTS